MFAHTSWHISWCDVPSSVKFPKRSKTLQNPNSSFISSTLWELVDFLKHWVIRNILCIYSRVKRQGLLLFLLTAYLNICHLVLCSITLVVCGYISLQKSSSQPQPCCLMFMPQVMLITTVSFVRVHSLCYIYKEVIFASKCISLGREVI